MESRLYLRVSDLEALTGNCRRSCERKIQQIRDALGKKKRNNKRYQEITIPEYCKYEGIPLDEVLAKIKVKG